MGIKRVVALTGAMLMLGLTGCQGNIQQEKIDAAWQEGSMAAEAEWSAKEIEIEANRQNGLGAAVNKNIEEFEVGLANRQTDEDEALGETNSIITYVIDRRTGLFHKVACEEVDKITQVNRENFYGSREEALAGTWQACTICKP